MDSIAGAGAAQAPAQAQAQAQAQPQNPLAQLRDNELFHVFSFLPALDLLRCSHACREWRGEPPWPSVCGARDACASGARARARAWTRSL